MDGAGNIKVTRDDWLRAAMTALIEDGSDQVKVMTLGARLGVSRSSFYWYFQSRQDLLDALLDHWMRTNTAAVVAHAEMPADTITQAVCQVFLGFVTPRHFDIRLDFAVRDWARRCLDIRAVVEASDGKRLEALTAMFARYGYGKDDAATRARVLYYMQIGYNDADVRESPADRLR